MLATTIDSVVRVSLLQYCVHAPHPFLKWVFVILGEFKSLFYRKFCKNSILEAKMSLCVLDFLFYFYLFFINIKKMKYIMGVGCNL